MNVKEKGVIMRRPAVLIVAKIPIVYTVVRDPPTVKENN
jgi:hypothetical protein